MNNKDFYLLKIAQTVLAHRYGVDIEDVGYNIKTDEVYVKKQKKKTLSVRELRFDYDLDEILEDINACNLEDEAEETGEF
jgi:hypothetical protein